MSEPRNLRAEAADAREQTRPAISSEPVTPPRRGGILDAFQVRSFRFQWPSDGLTIWAFEMETLVLGWYILTVTDSPALVGLIGTLRFGGTLFGPVYGALTDRFNRRMLLIVDRAVLSLIALVFTGLALSGALEPWHAFVFAFLTGVARNLDNVVRQALLADVMPARSLSNALALSRSVMDISRISGALLGGALLSALGIGEAYVAIVLLYAGSSLLSMGIVLRPPARPGQRARLASKGGPGWLRDLREGVGYMRRDPAILGPLVLAFLVNLTLFPTVNGLMPIVAREVYDRGPNGLAVMQMASGIGALAGSVALAAYAQSATPMRRMMIGIALWHLSMLAFAMMGWWLAALATLVVYGTTQSLAMISMSTTLLQAAPVELRGRVMGVRSLAVYGLPMGLLISGVLAEWLGIRTALAINSVVGLGGTAVAAFVWRGLWAKAGGGAPAAAQEGTTPESATAD
ncbi:MAG: MFS transporter [Chloroflexi bacterium]|nr:MFS transporter [Chloroflexota bacterium]